MSEISSRCFWYIVDILLAAIKSKPVWNLFQSGDYAVKKNMFKIPIKQNYKFRNV